MKNRNDKLNRPSGYTSRSCVHCTKLNIFKRIEYVKHRNLEEHHDMLYKFNGCSPFFPLPLSLNVTMKEQVVQIVFFS